jgi:sporulation protein YlmC with PRC-barrel domain
VGVREMNRWRKTLDAVSVAVVLCLTAAGEASAQDADQGAGPSEAVRRYRANGFISERLHLMLRASQLIGTVVRDREIRELGKVEDLIFDPASGQLLCVLVSPGEVLEEQPFSVAVPARSFLSADKTRVILDMPKSSLVNAPRFPENRLGSAAASNAVNQSYNYFHQKPAWGDKMSFGEICRCSACTGSEVRNKADEKLGKVVDWMVDLPKGRVIYAVISYDESGAKLYATPPMALAADPGRNILLLDADAVRITALGQHDAFFWTEITDPLKAAAIYQTFGRQADFTTPPAPSWDSGKPRMSAAVADSAPGKTDAEITRDVLMAIMGDDIKHPMEIKELKIFTVNGEVTLRGEAVNAMEKSKIGAIAEGIAGHGNVNNLLTTQ